ncbi:MAG: hypothetical protein A2Y25_01795 [Candidatus Melainabacteria bacterium GWF2_37_15]|nr:MAG: hypothetical protein A2Y25_01795 [Candidatus Melainabacteria bacterium GWF2_37_15]
MNLLSVGMSSNKNNRLTFKADFHKCNAESAEISGEEKLKDGTKIPFTITPGDRVVIEQDGDKYVGRFIEYDHPSSYLYSKGIKIRDDKEGEIKVVTTRIGDNGEDRYEIPVPTQIFTEEVFNQHDKSIVRTDSTQKMRRGIYNAFLRDC